jgi:hypothetical protein
MSGGSEREGKENKLANFFLFIKHMLFGFWGLGVCFSHKNTDLASGNSQHLCVCACARECW